MKKLLVVLLVASLAANAAFIVLRVSKTPSAVTGSAGGGGSENPSTRDAARKTADGAATAAASAEAAQVAKAWEQVQGGDIRTLADRLRAAGFPPEIVRAIVSAQVYEQFSARRKALLSQQEEAPFWKSQQWFVLDPKISAELRTINREQLSLMKTLLGADAYAARDELIAYQKRQFGNLPADKLDDLQNITQDYNELRQRIYQEANGVMLPEDREKIVILEKEQRADMARVLTPEELENYDLRTSSTANTLRNNLTTFRPTEEEFRAIFRAARAAEEQYGSLTMTANPDQMRQIQAAALENAKATLPPDRFADLKQATDPQYQMINRLVSRLELPPSASVQVVAVQQDTMKQANAIRTNKDLSADQRNAQLSALAQEASAKISTSLGGARGLEAYKNYGGQWLQNIAPRPNPTPGAIPGTGTISPKGG